MRGSLPWPLTLCTINFNGELVNQTCTIAVDGGVTPAVATVTLPTPLQAVSSSSQVWISRRALMILAPPLTRWARSPRPGKVITDCNMPLMNGYKLARAIRDEELARGLQPGLILGLTANAQPEEKDRCIEAGMDDCLFKPITNR